MKPPSYIAVTQLLEKGQHEAAMHLFEARKNEMTECERLECLGNYHFYKNQKQEAIYKYEEAVRIDPQYQSARHHYIAGIKAELQGNYSEAYERYNAAIIIEPTFVDAYVELGGVLVKLEDFELAARVYEDALAIDSDDLRIYANLKEVYEVLSNRKGDAFKEKYKVAVQRYKEAAKHLNPIGKNYKW